MADFPSMPLWTGDYLADTQDLSAEEHGVYMLLLMAAWRSTDATLPDDDQRLARMAKVGIKKWRKLRPVMERFFTVQNGLIWQKRLVEERRKVEAQRAQKREAANARWNNENDETLSLSASHGNATSKSHERRGGNDKALKNNDDRSATALSPDMRQKCPPSPSPTDSSPPPSTPAARGQAADAEGRDLVSETCQQVQQAVNAPTPMNNIAPTVRKWLGWGCVPETDIVPTIREVMQRREGEPPGTITYFDRPVWRALQERQQAPPSSNRSGGKPVDDPAEERRLREEWNRIIAPDF